MTLIKTIAWFSEKYQLRVKTLNNYSKYVMKLKVKIYSTISRLIKIIPNSVSKEWRISLVGYDSRSEFIAIKSKDNYFSKMILS